MNKVSSEVDYMAALDQFRKDQETDQKSLHHPERPQMEHGEVDYLAVSKQWEEERMRIFSAEAFHH